MAKLITVEGEVKEVHPQDTENGFTLEEVYNLIGRGCDMVEIAFRFTDEEEDDEEYMAICDEEGLMRQPQQPYNWKATSMFIEKYHEPLYLAGNIVICNQKEFQ